MLTSLCCTKPVRVSTRKVRLRTQLPTVTNPEEVPSLIGASTQLVLDPRLLG